MSLASSPRSSRSISRGDARWARAGLGDRAERIGYPWRAVASRGGLLAFGADAPYEDIDPWPGLAMAVTR